MSVFRQIGVVALSALCSAVFLAAPASADPSDDPCELAVTFLCHFVPIAPDLDHNIDLTQLQPPVDQAGPLPESLPPADICANGCI
jgi:hypothetical protein